MDLSGEYRIPTSPQAAWDALNDPEVLKACIPGCRELQRVSDSEFSAVVTSKVGPISATFRGSVALQDLDPPRAYTLAGQGQGGAAGFAKMKSRVTLAEDGGATLLRYEAQAEVGGKLAAVGSRLVQAVAKKNADDFFAAFATRFGGEGVAPAAPGFETAPEAAAAAVVEPAAVAEATAPAARQSPASASTGVPTLAPWVIALIAGGCGVVLGFILGRFCA